MKNLRLIILLALFSTGTGLFAQDAVNEAVDQQTQPEPAPVEAVAEAVEGIAAEVKAIVEEATEESTSEEVAEAIEEDTTGGASAVTLVEEPEWNYRGELVLIGSDNVLGPNERSKEMVTIAGNSTVDGYVDGDMVTILGNSTVNGYVDGDYVVVMGSAEFGAGAELDGDVVVIGGKLTVHPDAKIDGERVNIPFLPAGIIDHFQEVPIFIRECVFLARPISPNVIFTFYVAGVFLLFYILLAAIFPKPLERSRHALEEKPFQSFLAGMLVHAAYLPFVILMAITVIGLVLVPFVKLGILALTTFGKAVVFFYIGKQIAKAIHASALENAILSIIIGGVIVYAMYMIPFFGLFLWIVLSTLGLGAVCIAIGESISEKKAARQAAMPSTPPRIPIGPGGEATAQPHYSGPVQPGTALSQVDTATAALFNRVGFWWRTLATLIDFILIGVIVSVLSIGMPIIPFFAYFIIFWGWKGSTLGGMALGIRIQKISGEPLDWSTAIIRSLSSIVSLLPCFLGFFWAGWDPENQSWHDKIAGTTVVQVPKGYTWS